MSGHSKWENIKHKKGAEDRKRGQAFGKLAKLITIAVKEGGSNDPEVNPRLRVAISKARAANMPKENIERAMNRDKTAGNLEEFFLEGYGPGGVAVMVEILTDNRQRSIQEVKNIFTRYGGSVAEPGSVSFQFERRGEVKLNNVDDQELLGLMTDDVLDFYQSGKSVVFYLAPDKIESFRQFCQGQSKNPQFWQVSMVAKSPVSLDEWSLSRFKEFLRELSDNEDVSKVFTNLKK